MKIADIKKDIGHKLSSSIDEIADKYCSSNSAGVTLFLNQDISYATGNFTGAEVIDAAEHGAAGIVGKGGFWKRSEERIKQTVDDVLSKNFK